MYRLLLAMSTLPEDRNNPSCTIPIQTGKCILEKNDEFAGLEKKNYEWNAEYYGQLEPIPYYYLDNYHEDIEILVINTSETNEIKKISLVKEDGAVADPQSDSAYGFFKKNIEEYAKTRNVNVSFIEFDLDMDNYAICIGEIVSHLRVNHKTGDRLWIDIHGGLRDVMLPLSSIISLLDAYSIKYDCVLSVVVEKQPPNKIHDVKKQYESLNFMTGIREFIQYGSAKSLDTDVAIEPKDQKLVSIINGISDGIRICDPVRYKDSLERLKEYFNDNNRNNSENNDKNDRDGYLEIFKEYIKGDYRELINNNSDNIDIYIIERCVEKNLLHQALTFLETLMPSVFIEKGLFERDPGLEDRLARRGVDLERCPVDNKQVFNDYIFKLAGVGNSEKKDNRAVNMINYAGTHPEKIVFSQEVNSGNKEQLTYSISIYNSEKERKEYIKENYDVVINVDRQYRKEIEQLFMLHWALKRCRNILSHAKSAKHRPSADKISHALKLYCTLFKQLQDKGYAKKMVWEKATSNIGTSMADKLHGISL